MFKRDIIYDILSRASYIHGAQRHNLWYVEIKKMHATSTLNIQCVCHMIFVHRNK